MVKSQSQNFGRVVKGFGAYVRSQLATHDECGKDNRESLTTPQCGRLTQRFAYGEGNHFDCFYWRWDSADYHTSPISTSTYSFFAFSPLNLLNAELLEKLVKRKSTDAEEPLKLERKRREDDVHSRTDYFFREYRKLMKTKDATPKGTHYIVKDFMKDYLDTQPGRVLFTHTVESGREETEFFTAQRFFDYSVVRGFAEGLFVPRENATGQFKIDDSKELFNSPFFAFTIGGVEKAVAFAPNFDLGNIRYGTLVSSWPHIFEDGNFRRGIEFDPQIDALREMLGAIKEKE